MKILLEKDLMNIILGWGKTVPQKTCDQKILILSGKKDHKIINHEQSLNIMNRLKKK